MPGFVAFTDSTCFVSSRVSTTTTWMSAGTTIASAHAYRRRERSRSARTTNSGANAAAYRPVSPATTRIAMPATSRGRPISCTRTNRSSSATIARYTWTCSVLSHTSGSARVPTRRRTTAASLAPTFGRRSDGHASAIHAMRARTPNDIHAVTSGARSSGTSDATQVATLGKRL